MEEARRNDEWLIKTYEEGSVSCRNYSNLTMRVRTLAQHVLVVGVAGLAVLMVEFEKDEEQLPYAILMVSFSLLLFSISLFLVDWHYQSAFTGIRNQLAKMECENGISGPWLAHLCVRTHLNDHIASYLPFILLGILGGIGLWWGGVKHPGLAYVAFGVLGIVIILFVVFLIIASKNDKRIREELKKGMGSQTLRGGFDPGIINKRFKQVAKAEIPDQKQDTGGVT